MFPSLGIYTVQDICMMGGYEAAGMDAVTIVIKECISLSTAMRKFSKLTSQSGVVALLAGNSEIFNDDKNIHKFSKHKQANKPNDPYLSGFIQLRLMLNKLNSLDEVDSLTVLQPFLILLTASSVSGYITSLALDSLQKFFTMNIINENSKNYKVAYRELIEALTHCRFESSSQISDDAVLFKVLLLTCNVINSPYGDVITDSLMYDVLQTILTLACNNRRSDVLRKAAEENIISITYKLFSKIKNFKKSDISGIYVNDEAYANNALNGDSFGITSPSADDLSVLSTVDSPAPANIDSKLEGTKDNETNDNDSSIFTKTEEISIQNADNLGTQDEEKENPNESFNSIESKTNVEVQNENNRIINESEEEPYGLPVARQYLSLLLSLILPDQKIKHTTTTRIFALKLINVATEVTGDKLPLHPRLFNLVSDPIFKSVLFIIQSTDKLSLLQAALQLFTTFVVILGQRLQPQIELTLKRIFAILSDDDGKSQKKTGNNTEKTKIKSPAVKELLVEQIAILWSRSPLYFTSTFIDFDCNLDRTDLSIKFLKVLAKLSLPESAISTTPSVPPICLEGLISFVDDLYDQLRSLDRNKYLEVSNDIPDLLKQRELKTEFIRCAEAFNKKPKNGVPMLIEKNFIRSDKDRDIAEFLFENNSRLNKKTLGLYLCDPKKTGLLQEFIDFFDFKGLRVDEAIRVLLTKFRLPGESQQIERIVEAFSKKYVADQNYNPEKLTVDEEEEDMESIQPDSDSVFVLSYSIIMLNTDLHNPQVKEHMSFEDYSGNLKGCNNSKDFPFWYLDRIYCSIRDKEIVMPEEHHGNERWFEDAWNNLISSTTVVTEVDHNSTSTTDNLTLLELEKFNKAICVELGELLVNTFFKIFIIATDDHISTKMLGSIEKFAYISYFFEMKDLYNDIMHKIAVRTSLLKNPSDEMATSEQANEDLIPLVEIKIDDEEQQSIVVSNASVRIGRSFKAQLACMTLFRLFQMNEDPTLLQDRIWSDIADILTALYQNLLISPDIFPDLQNRLVLSNLPRRNPDLTISRTTENRGFLSTFASYLKGDEEPTEEDIEAAVKAQECVKNCGIPSSLFGNEKNITPILMRKLLGSVDLEKNSENSSYFESQILFMSELVVGLFLFSKDDKETGEYIVKTLFEFSELADLSKRCVRRLMTYKVLLLSILEVDPKYLDKIVSEDFLKNEVAFGEKYLHSKHGKVLIKSLLTVSEIEHYRRHITNLENFWTFLRKLSVNKDYVSDIYLYADQLLKSSKHVITEKNFMWVLGLLDEISSFGSVGSKWEKEYSTLVATGHKVEKENPFQELVEVSLRSINLTAHLMDQSNFPDFYTNEVIIAIVQALAHQCTNPCEQLRSYAVSSLQDSLIERIQIPSDQVQSLEQILEQGILPILLPEGQNANSQHMKEVFPMITKVYFHYLKKGSTTNDTFLKVLNMFNSCVEDPEIENQLQQFIIMKKEIEAEST